MNVMKLLMNICEFNSGCLLALKLRNPKKRVISPFQDFPHQPVEYRNMLLLPQQGFPMLVIKNKKFQKSRKKTQ
ncbi:hypothetical protein D5278_10050 [bacterium 1XD21-13]|nr:hypothetical protein [bacterium 1XD21-13]